MPRRRRERRPHGRWHRPHSFPQTLVAGRCARSDDDEALAGLRTCSRSASGRLSRPSRASLLLVHRRAAGGIPAKLSAAAWDSVTPAAAAAAAAALRQAVSFARTGSQQHGYGGRACRKPSSLGTPRSCLPIEKLPIRFSQSKRHITRNYRRTDHASRCPDWRHKGSFCPRPIGS